MEFLGQEFGPLTEEQDDVLTTVASPITQRIASYWHANQGSCPARSGQDMLTAAVQKLFQLDKPDLIETGQEN